MSLKIKGQGPKLLVIMLAVTLLLWVVWSYIANWGPGRDEYPTQGIAIGQEAGAVDWPRLNATGVDFAYLTATRGDKERDAKFAENLEGAKNAGVRFGALHKFDLCRLASDQAELFITTVPREANALPAAVEVHFSDTCNGRPDRSLILSELSTFLQQIEAHTGMPSLLLLSEDFEHAYKISSAIDREFWVEGTWFLPNYTVKSWKMWTANSARRIDGVEGPVKWLVVPK